MIASVPDSHFDRGKPFYPLIINYLVQFHGFVELDSRYVADRLAGFDPDRIEEAFKKKGLDSVAKRLVGGEVTKLIVDLALRSEFQGNSIAIDVEALSAEIVGQHSHVLSRSMALAGSLLILAYEMKEGSISKRPLLDF